MSKKETRFPDLIRKAAVEVKSDIPGLRGFMFQGPDGSQVVFWECDERTEVKPHQHDYDEYCLVVEGSCRETIEGVTTELRKGGEIVIPAGKKHWAVMGPGYRAIDYFAGPRLRYNQ